MRRQFREDKMKSGREHRSIRRYGRVRKMKGTPEIKKEVCNLRDRRTGNRMAPRMKLRAISGPLRLII